MVGVFLFLPSFGVSHSFSEATGFTSEQFEITLGGGWYVDSCILCQIIILNNKNIKQ